GADQDRHQGEPGQVHRGHREAPVDPEDPVGGEPEEREVDGPVEPLGEGPGPRPEVPGQARQPGVEGEVVDPGPGDREDQGRDQDVEGDHRGGYAHEGATPRVERPAETREDAPEPVHGPPGPIIEEPGTPGNFLRWRGSRGQYGAACPPRCNVVRAAPQRGGPTHDTRGQPP